MRFILLVITVLIGLEHVGIMLFELLAKPEQLAKAFEMEPSFTKQTAARIAMANQGIYNGMLGILLVLTPFLFHGSAAVLSSQLLLLFVGVVGLYGAVTVSRKIIWAQLVPAIVGLVCSFLI